MHTIFDEKSEGRAGVDFALLQRPNVKVSVDVDRGHGAPDTIHHRVKQWPHFTDKHGKRTMGREQVDRGHSGTTDRFPRR